ncbi:hypothetical protein QNI16_07300 [Cytophagaceae bacterium YF14B1]|uniref:Uncharacterized protein n=1 Tax=Xanthocytophaga flava TaxID=3048013 RepID=A0AAE3QK01_9BACT|nr:hypothetical protein [Xanthocytophaga flavus]MDJ1472835.1 hypothetical protein [Xanthocytophaga flavus]MDJ1480285.1 hypothetical protein [Xanthocytophaga flavus]
MHTWGVFVLACILFSIQIIVSYHDREKVASTQQNVQTVKKQVDSLRIAQKINDQIKTQEMKLIRENNKQLQEIVVNHDVFIRQLKTDIIRLRKNEKGALHEISQMSDEDLMRYWANLNDLNKTPK